jgi:hypothetical protein
LLQCLSNEDDKILANTRGEDLWLKLFENGFKFLLIDASLYKSFADNLNLAHPPEWVELSTLYETESLYAYKITFTQPPSNNEPKTCERKSSTRIWEVVSP